MGATLERVLQPSTGAPGWGGVIRFEFVARPGAADVIVQVAPRRFMRHEFTRLQADLDTLSVTDSRGRGPPRVFFHEDRWLRGPDPAVAVRDAAHRLVPASSRLYYYRTYLVNHELGHACGLGHAPPQQGKCSVMTQQTKDTRGALFNPVPTARDKADMRKAFLFGKRRSGTLSGGGEPAAWTAFIAALRRQATAQREFLAGRVERDGAQAKEEAMSAQVQAERARLEKEAREDPAAVAAVERSTRLATLITLAKRAVAAGQLLRHAQSELERLHQILEQAQAAVARCRAALDGVPYATAERLRQAVLDVQAWDRVQARKAARAKARAARRLRMREWRAHDRVARAKAMANAKVALKSKSAVAARGILNRQGRRTSRNTQQRLAAEATATWERM